MTGKADNPGAKRKRVGRPPGGRRTEKVSISLDSRLLSEARTAAKRAKRSLSAQIAEAVQAQLRRGHLVKALEEFDAEFGAPTEAQKEAARAELARAVAKVNAG